MSDTFADMGSSGAVLVEALSIAAAATGAPNDTLDSAEMDRRKSAAEEEPWSLLLAVMGIGGIVKV